MALYLAVACSGGKTSGIAPELLHEPASLDFGKARPGARVERTLEIQSGSAVALEIAAVGVEDDPASPGGAIAFSVVESPEHLDAQATGRAVLAFAAPGEGDFRAVLVVASNDPRSPARVSLTGRGANPKLRLLAECAAPCAGFTAAESPPALDFGACRPLHKGPGDGSVEEPEWPTVTLLNEGELPVTILGVSLSGDAAFSTVERLDAAPFPIAAGAGQGVHVRFDPHGSQASFSGTLVVESDDPAAPIAQVALTGTLAAPTPPTVCAAIVESQGADGSIAVPEGFFAAQPPVQPGRSAQVTFSAHSDHFLVAPDASLCTTSPETGRDGLRYLWTILERPGSSSARLSGETSAQPTLRPDAIGRYRVRLTATDPNGLSGQAEVAFDAFLRRDLVAELSWEEAGIDLDLHLVRPAGSCAGGSCVFDPQGDVNGFSALGGQGWEWGLAGAADDPRLDRDDQGTQGGIETVSLDHPQNDPACAQGPCAYGLYVHYFADNRAGSGSGHPCPGLPCSEGEQCGCASGSTCVASRCVTPARPRVAVHLKPSSGAAPVLVPTGSADFSIAGPCFLWHLADVVWRPDGTAEVVEAGAAGGWDLAYYGKMDPGSFACAPNTAPGLPAGYVPGPVPHYP
ncbi:MAG: choice-of-anchor D domain-containing protein [Deltaproteobacteria bacterium]|nr:choice-of-anchor D domain-containing protein [Deltaproteobacteria bacterium]